MNAREPLSDAGERFLAATSLGETVIVEAGAGTGKTALLVERILYLLLGRGPGGAAVPMRALVALTFTEKAAAEIKLRLAERLNALLGALSGEEGDESSRRVLEVLRDTFGRDEEECLALAREALSDIEKAQIRTIHAFCSQILRLYPLEAGLDPDFTIDASGEDMEEIFESEWALWLDRELGEAAPRGALWEKVLAHATLEDLEALALALARPRAGLVRAADAGRVAPRLRALSRRCEELGRAQPKPRGKILEYLDWMGRLFSAVADASEGRPASCAEAPARSAQWPANWDAGPKAEYEALVGVARRVRPEREALFRDILELLEPFLLAAGSARRRRGILDYDGLLWAARDLLREQPHVRAELKRRFAAVLVDEFQDTDPLQGEILLYLCEEAKGAARRWEETRPEPGKLFVVGDPKQSIYRFRGADISATESFYAHLRGHGARTCALKTNFRSRAALIESVNGIFGALMRPQPGLQPAYSAIEPAPRAPMGEGPVWWQLGGEDAGSGVGAGSGEDAGAGAAASRSEQAEWIARWVRSERARRPLREVALLLRSFGPLPVFLDAFRRHAIPYVVEGERHFFGSQEILDALAALRAIDDPTDKIALAGLLRSPFGGFSDRELARLARRGELDYRRKGSAAEPLYARLRALHESAGRRPLVETVRALFLEGDWLCLAAEAYHHQQTVSNLLKLLRLASEASGRGLTLKRFVARIESSVKEFREEGESPLADEHLDAVRILSVHKAKGLEYPVVIMPNLSGSVRRGASGGALGASWGRAELGLRLERKGFVNAAMALGEAEEEARRREEEVRLLYVAMTRAKERLILLGHEGRRGASFASLLDGCGVLAPKPAPWPEPRGEEPGAAGPQEDWTLCLERWRERERRRDEALGPAVLRPSSVGAFEFDWERPEEGSVPAATLGRLCHAVLERWEFRPDGLSPGLAEAVAAARARLGEEGAHSEELEKECRELLGCFLRSSAALEIARGRIWGREIPVLHAEGGRVVRGVIDLVYESGQGLIVADYKTDRLGPGREAALREKYARQGELYVRAVRAALGVREARFTPIFLRAS